MATLGRPSCRATLPEMTKGAGPSFERRPPSNGPDPTLFGTRVAGGVIFHTSLARFLRRARRELLSAHGHSELTEDAGRAIASGGEQRC